MILCATDLEEKSQQGSFSFNFILVTILKDQYDSSVADGA